MRIKNVTYKIIGRFGTWEVKRSLVVGLRLRRPVAVRKDHLPKR